MSVEIGTEADPIPRKGIHKWDLPCIDIVIVRHRFKGTVRPDWIRMRVLLLDWGLEKDINRYMFLIF